MSQNEPVIVTIRTEQRQIARVLEFEPTHARHINWNSIAGTAQDMGAHFEARWTDAGACTIVMFWAYGAEVTE